MRHPSLVFAFTLGLCVAASACTMVDDGASDPAPAPGGSGGSGGDDAVPVGQGAWSDGGVAGAAGSVAAAGSGGAAGSSSTGGSGGQSAGGSAGSGPDASCPRVQIDVADGATLNVRPTPSTAQPAVGVLADGAIVDLLGEVQGETIGGNALWYQIAAPSLTGYIFSAYATCTLDEPIATPKGFFVPLGCGSSAKISQGNFGSYSHQGKAKYAFDFAIPVGTPMTAMADGTVLHIYDKTGPGDPCYNGGGSSCFPYANLVVLLHGDGSTTLYKHLSKVSVSKGQFVARGTKVGLSGSTGYSTGPHAHVMRMENCGLTNCQSIPLKFADFPGGVPETGQVVKSGNCP